MGVSFLWSGYQLHRRSQPAITSKPLIRPPFGSMASPSGPTPMSTFVTPLLPTSCMLSCPACDTPFRSAHVEAVPMALACGHSVCRECSDALLNTLEPMCCVCFKKTDAAIVNHALADFSEAINGPPTAAATVRDVSASASDAPLDIHHKGSCCIPGRCAVELAPPANSPLVTIASPPGYRPMFDTIASVPAQESDASSYATEFVLHREVPAAVKAIHGTKRARISSTAAGDEPRIASELLVNAMTRCYYGSIAASKAAASILAARSTMDAKYNASVAQFNEAVSAVHAAIETYRQRVLAEAKLTYNERSKALEAQADELLVSSSQLRAAACLANQAREHRDVTCQSAAIDSVSKAIQLIKPFQGPVVAPVVEIVAHPGVVVDALAAHTRIRRYCVDGRRSVVSGVGLRHFRCSGNAYPLQCGDNMIHVMCVDGEGHIVPSVTAEDIAVTFAKPDPATEDMRTLDVKASVAISSPGCAIIAYEVPDGELLAMSLTLRVCGEIMGDACHIIARAKPNTVTVSGARVSDVLLAPGPKYGMAVTPDQQHVIVAKYGEGDCLLVYKADTGDLVRSIGRKGSAPGEFHYPFRVCATTASQLLVTDSGNNRVQEVTLSGRYVRSIHVESPAGIATNDDVIVVGNIQCFANNIDLFDYGSGAWLRRMAPCGSDPGEVSYAVGIRFLRDNVTFVVAEEGNRRLSLFDIRGEFRGWVGAGLLDDGHKDVEVSGSGEFIVADCGARKIRVLSADGSSELRHWQVAGEDDTLYSPTSLAACGDTLFVLGMHSPVIAVFK